MKGIFPLPLVGVLGPPRCLLGYSTTTTVKPAP